MDFNPLEDDVVVIEAFFLSDEVVGVAIFTVFLSFSRRRSRVSSIIFGALSEIFIKSLFQIVDDRNSSTL